MICGILVAAGYDVSEAGDGHEGIEIYRHKPLDLVLTDMIMPNTEGVETILQLKQEFPDVRIVAMSGGGRMGAGAFLNLAGKFGARDTLEKPFSKDRLLATVEQVLNDFKAIP